MEISNGELLRMNLLRLLIVTLMTGCVTASSAVQVQVASDAVRLQLSLGKTQFLQNEPIVAVVTLVNASETARRLAEPSESLSTVGIRVFAVAPSVLPPMQGCQFAFPPDYLGRLFGPLQSSSMEADLQDSFCSRLSIGRYTASASYGADSYIKDVWNGRLGTPEIEFEVVDAGRHKAAADDFREGQRLLVQRDGGTKALKLFEKLRDRSYAGVFSDYAQYYCARACRLSGDMTGAVARARDYLRDHPSVPCFSRRARVLLADTLCACGDYAGAMIEYGKLPNDYERSCLINKCKRKMKKL